MFDLRVYRQQRHKFTQYSSKSVARETNIFIYIHFGKLRFECKDGSIYIAEKNTIVYIPKGALYVSTYLEENTEITSVQFQMCDNDEDFTFSDSIEMMEPVFAKYYEPLFNAFHKPLSTENLLLGRMHHLFTLFEALLDANYDKYNDPRYKTIQPGVNMLRDRFNENLPISELAKAANISECYFRRIFKYYFGVSPIEYRNKLRIAYIRDLIQNHVCTVSEAVASAGIDNTSYYYKLKKKLVPE